MNYGSAGLLGNVNEKEGGGKVMLSDKEGLY